MRPNARPSTLTSRQCRSSYDISSALGTSANLAAQQRAALATASSTPDVLAALARDSHLECPHDLASARTVAVKSGRCVREDRADVADVRSCVETSGARWSNGVASFCWRAHGAHSHSLLRVLSDAASRRPCGGAAAARAGGRCRGGWRSLRAVQSGGGWPYGTRGWGPGCAGGASLGAEGARGSSGTTGQDALRVASSGARFRGAPLRAKDAERWCPPGTRQEPRHPAGRAARQESGGLPDIHVVRASASTPATGASAPSPDRLRPGIR